MPTATQARSRATERRILDALEAALSDRPFDTLAMTEIAAAAGVSIGGIYARFDNKEALLHALHARYEVERTDRMRSALDADRLGGEPLETRVRAVVAAVVELMSERRALLRTFLLRYWTDPGLIRGPFAGRLDEVYRLATEVLRGSGAADRQRISEARARVALAVVLGACRDIVVMKPAAAPGAVDLTPDELITHLTAAALGMLAVETPGAT